MRLPDLTDLALPGATLAVRVTPKASRNAIERDNGTLRIYVTTVPENGKANAAVQKMLAKALGVSKSQLVLTRGETARDKVFRLNLPR